MKLHVNIDRFAELRKTNQLNQSELARKVGVTRYSINHIEKGIMTPSLPLAGKIAKVFNCKVDDFIFFK